MADTSLSLPFYRILYIISFKLSAVKAKKFLLFPEKYGNIPSILKGDEWAV
jgi:hypothetical protein